MATTSTIWRARGDGLLAERLVLDRWMTGIAFLRYHMRWQDCRTTAGPPTAWRCSTASASIDRPGSSVSASTHAACCSGSRLRRR